jgi:hypothetical protein
MRSRALGLGTCGKQDRADGSAHKGWQSTSCWTLIELAHLLPAAEW